MAAFFLPSAAALLGQSTSSPVLAYLDPGTGSMLFQFAIAGLLSSMFFAKQSFQVLRSRLSAKKS
jgi:hypothetical protein